MIKIVFFLISSCVYGLWNFDLQYAPLYDGYYSQCGQDKFLKEMLFKDKSEGFFIDIGAHNGIYFSNTYFFEKSLNWVGLCIEPNPSRFKELVKNRPNSICLNCCVSNYSGFADFLYVSGYSEMLSGLCSGYNKEHLKRVEKEVSEGKQHSDTIKVEVVDFIQLLDIYKISYVDILSIDVEGSEFDILSGIPFSKVKIDVIVVENNYGDLKIRMFLKKQGYKFIVHVGDDDIYKLNM